jgi:hypothetical protein
MGRSVLRPYAGERESHRTAIFLFPFVGWLNLIIVVFFAREGSCA